MPRSRKAQQPLLAMVALSKPALPDEEKIVSFFEKAWPKGPEIRFLEQQGGLASFELEDERGKLALMPAPIPWIDLEWPVSVAWYWPEARKKLLRHKAHILVALTGREETDLSLARRCLALSRVTAAVAAVTKAAGVYWGAAPLVMPTDGFVLGARNGTDAIPPIHLWVSFSIFSDKKKRIWLCTTGLHAFDLLEIETRCEKRKATDVIQTVAGIALLELMRGRPVGENGGSVPGPGGEDVHVKVGPSVLQGRGEVMTLEIR
ncbi:hypothetical protein HY251_21555 [bacterium]|nr:hypothetical protein [bacterium]